MTFFDLIHMSPGVYYGMVGGCVLIWSLMIWYRRGLMPSEDRVPTIHEVFLFTYTKRIL